MPTVKFPSVVCVASPTFGFNIDLLLRHLLPSYSEHLVVLGVPQLLFSSRSFGDPKLTDYPSLADLINYYWVCRGLLLPSSPICGPSPFNHLAGQFTRNVAQEDTTWDVLQIPFLSTELAHLSPLFIPADNESYFSYDHRLHAVLDTVREKLLSFPMITDKYPSYDPDYPTAGAVFGVPLLVYPNQGRTLTQCVNSLLAEYRFEEGELITLRELGDILGLYPVNVGASIWDSNYLEWFDLTTAFLCSGRTQENLMDVFPDVYPSKDIFTDLYMNSKHVDKIYSIIHTILNDPSAIHYQKELVGEYPEVTPIVRYLKEVGNAFAFQGNMGIIDALRGNL